MIYKIKTRDEHFENDETPKRILGLGRPWLKGHPHSEDFGEDRENTEGTPRRRRRLEVLPPF